MNIDKNYMEPLEVWLEAKQKEAQQFPNNRNDYFDLYWSIKQYCAQNIYPYIGAGTSAEDGGIYTDHSLDHFNNVIRYAGKLLDIRIKKNSITLSDFELALAPYEVFILLTSILLHDAGNIEGRQKHEQKTHKIIKLISQNLDSVERNLIAAIAKAHGGKTTDASGNESKDTIVRLKEKNTFLGIAFRPKLLAAIVRFADEICEDRSRAARYYLENGILPKKSEVFHQYAYSITSVDVDTESKSVSIKFEVLASNLIKKFGKDNGSNTPEEVYLIDEINHRLEKMYCEMQYCKSHMFEIVPINQLRAAVAIYEDEDQYEPLREESFELKEAGYPVSTFSFRKVHPDWCGEKVERIILEKKVVVK